MVRFAMLAALFMREGGCCNHSTEKQTLGCWGREEETQRASTRQTQEALMALSANMPRDSKLFTSAPTFCDKTQCCTISLRSCGSFLMLSDTKVTLENSLIPNREDTAKTTTKHHLASRPLTSPCSRRKCTNTPKDL